MFTKCKKLYSIYDRLWDQNNNLVEDGSIPRADLHRKLTGDRHREGFIPLRLLLVRGLEVEVGQEARPSRNELVGCELRGRAGDLMSKWRPNGTPKQLTTDAGRTRSH